MILLAAVSSAVPELNPSQQQQLDTATDDSGMLDEAAWYPLLQNVLLWEGDTRPGSMNPDYQAMLADPARFRGRRFFIKGKFAGMPRNRQSLRAGRLARPGPWDDRLEQWGIVVQQDPDQVVVVCLVAPPAMPRPGAPIEVVARFYKVWKTLDLRNEPTRFLVFVGKSAAVTPSAGGRGPTFLPIVLPLVVALGLVWLILRRSIAGPRVEGPRRAPRQRPVDPPEMPATAEPDSLPTDPAEALRELSRRGGF